jgi:hypothetical protein
VIKLTQELGVPEKIIKPHPAGCGRVNRRSQWEWLMPRLISG